MNQLAVTVAKIATHEIEDETPAKSSRAVKAGKARASQLSATRRREIAQKAARTRWRKQG